MKKSVFVVLCIAFSLLKISGVKAQEQSDTTKVVLKSSNKKEEQNRNVMLNAGSNTGPRDVNIGLPFRGDIIILENDVPVVYYFWPTIPTYAWRMSNSLSRMGLLSFAEGALTYGKVGFAVKSFDRGASRKFKGFASLYANSFGSSKYDLTVTGPMGKKGWGYMLNAYQHNERGNGTNYQFTPWQARTSMLKAAIEKKYKNGTARLIYKVVDAKGITSNYNPLMYLGNGKTKPLSDFDLGVDSYILGSGILPYADPKTGEAGMLDLTDDKYSRSTSHNLYLTGDHKFKNGMKLKYSTMWQKMNTPMSITFPLSIGITSPERQGSDVAYYYHGTKVPYDGAVQMVINQIIPQSDVTALLSRAELIKEVNGHNLRLGITHQYNHRKYISYGGMYMQTVKSNPELLDRYYIAAPGMEFNITPDGLLPDGQGGYAGGYGSYTDDTFNKTALYLSDDFSPTEWLDLSIGARIEHQNKKEIHDPTYTNEPIGDTKLITKEFNNDWNKVGTASAVVKLTKKFGLVGDFTYNSWWDSYWDYESRDSNGNPIASSGYDYPRTTIPKTYEQEVINYGGGFFLNMGNKLSIVSKITHIEKNNIRFTGASVQNPANPTERADFSPIFYNISTLGWSTDIVTNPFKNFNLHFLLTLQKPEYKDFSYGAFGVDYSYSNKIIPELSQTLIEIDPSYSFMKRKLKAWFSLRYFGKQYGDKYNSFKYNGWWENFGGLDYTVNRNVSIKFQVVNFLDQKGVKGAVQGSDQLKTDAAFIGQPIVAGAIRPRTFELKVDFKF